MVVRPTRRRQRRRRRRIRQQQHGEGIRMVKAAFFLLNALLDAVVVMFAFDFLHDDVAAVPAFGYVACLGAILALYTIVASAAEIVREFAPKPANTKRLEITVDHGALAKISSDAERGRRG